MTVYINGLFLGELKPSETIGGCIDIYENAWQESNTVELIESEISNNENISWSRARTLGKGVYQHERTNKDIGITYEAENSNNKLFQNIHNNFRTLLLASSLNYAKRYYIDNELIHEPYNLLKYSGGEEYKQHFDGETSTGRIISAICYLNDDFEGGELEFPNFNFKLKPQKNMLILFPSNFAYSHIAHPVTSGTKYALVTWIKDRQL